MRAPTLQRLGSSAGGEAPRLRQRRRMPKLLQQMFAGGAVHAIERHHHLLAFQEQHPPPMRESAVGAARIEGIAIGRCVPRGYGGVWFVPPTEGAGRHGLVPAIDANRVVRHRAAKTVPLGRVGVGIGSRIDERLPRADARHQAQRVGMAVSRRTRAKRPRFHHDVHIRRRHDGHAGVAEQPGAPPAPGGQPRNSSTRSPTTTPPESRSRRPEAATPAAGTIALVASVPLPNLSRSPKGWNSRPPSSSPTSGSSPEGRISACRYSAMRARRAVYSAPGLASSWCSRNMSSAYT